MVDTNCDFKISRIVSSASGRRVLLRVYEGFYSSVQRADSIAEPPEIVIEYRRSKLVGESEIGFLRAATGEQIVRELALRLGEYSAREPIPDQKASATP